VQEPPFAKTLRQDLKTAMRARDQLRLDTIRSVLAEITKSHKTQMPVYTDGHVFRLMRRLRMRAADSAAEFMTTGRKDLAERELAQMGLLKQYEDQTGVVLVSRAEMANIVQVAIAQAKQQDGFKGKIVPRVVIEQATKELSGKDFIRADLITEVNMQVRAAQQELAQVAGRN
jgi:uncharacterized protein YqeY